MNRSTETQNEKKLFSDIALFAHLIDSSEIEKLIEQAEHQHYQRGEDIVCEGETGHGMYILKTGAAQVYSHNHDGEETILCKLEQGQYFGEQSLLPGNPGLRNASVRATLSSEVLYVPAELFRNIVLNNDEQVSYLQTAGEEQVRNKLLQQSTVLRALSLQDKANNWVTQEFFKAGETVFQQGDPGDKFYLVVSGTAQASQKEGNTDNVIGRIPAGRYFGELALINSEPRSASITAETDLQLLSLKADAFKKLYDDSPELQDQMSHLCGVYQLSGQEMMTLHESHFLDMKSITAMYHFPDGVQVSSSKVVGKAIFSMSRLDVEESLLKRISYTRSKEGIMRELQLFGNQVISVTAYGNWVDLGRLHQLVLHKQRLWPWQLALFRQTGELWLEEEKEAYDPDAIICKCTGVTRGTLTDAVAQGCSSVQELAQKTGASQVCGSCAPLLAEIVGQTDMVTAKLLDIIPVTDDIKSFRFKPLSGEISPSLPGQHLRIEAQIEGRWVQRAYTLTSPAEQKDYYEITVKREEHGLFSRWLHDKLDEKSLIRISNAQGSYFLPETHSGAVMCFVGGIGTTPALGIMRTLVKNKDTRSLHVDYSAKTRDQFAYVDEWKTITDEHQNISINFRTSEEQGRVKQEDIVKLHNQYPDAMYFMCGPKRFQDAIADHIRNSGVHEENIKVESFVPPGGNKPAIPPLKYARLFLATAVSILLLCFFLMFQPDTLLPGNISTLTSDHQVFATEQGQKITGYSILGLLFLGLLMSLKKRWKSLPIGQYTFWRMLHIAIGLILAIVMLFHVSLEWGSQLKDLLFYCLLLTMALGSLVTLGLLLENRFNTQLTKKIKAGFYWIHIIVMWPLPVLLALHIYSVYYF